MGIFKSNSNSHELANHVSLQNLDSELISVDSNDESILVKGSLYYYKIGKHIENNDNKALEPWLNYVLYAGLLKFRFQKKRFKINLGLNLRDYYQNIRTYASIKRQKKLSYITGGKEISKVLDIVDVLIYPNIFAQAYALSKVIEHEEFIVLKLGKEDFEGILYNPRINKEKQTYILGEGLSDFIADLKTEKVMENNKYSDIKAVSSEDAKLKKQLKSYFNNHVGKKISRIVNLNANAPIILLIEEGISEYIGEIFSSFFSKDRIIQKYQGCSEIASEGLYLLDEFETYDAFNERVGVSISNDKTNFTSRKNSQLIS